MLDKIKPMLGFLVEKPFTKKGWIFEIKWDGFRILAFLNHRSVKLMSRNQKDYTEHFTQIKDALKTNSANMILDGEVVVLDEAGKSNFQLLQQFQKTGKGQLFYYVFDILWLNGKDLRQLPLLKRKKILNRVLPTSDTIKISEHIETEGEKLFKAAKALKLEGIMAKKADSLYYGNRSREWLKMKALHQQEAVIAGYTAPKGSRRYIGALILGMYDNREFIYIGHSSGRLNEKSLHDLKEQLDRLKTNKSPFKNPPKTNTPVTWIKPKLVCEIIFNEWTQAGHLRQPIFLGLREDKKPKQVHKEMSVHEMDIEISNINGKKLKLTNLNKIFWPKEGYTKKDLITYYRSVSELILPHLKNRPQVLHRFPNGIEKPSFFQKNFLNSPAWLKTKEIYSEQAKHANRYLLCQNEAALIYLINLGCIELNPWLSRISHLDKPDFCVIDLDPEGISFRSKSSTGHPSFTR
jgi:bifunctional non-homologous end joining protein LigD